MGSPILISVFLFAKDVGWEALATKPYTDTGVLLASNWRTQKQWERWPIALFISLAQTLKCERLWRYTSVISAEVNTSWTELQGKGSPPTHTLDKFWARKGIFCTVFPCQICTGLHKIYSCALLTKREVKMAGYWPSSFFFFAFLWTETGYDGFISSRTEILGKIYFTVDLKLIFHFLSSSLLPTVRGGNE